MASMDLLFRFVGLDAGAGRQFEKMGAYADATAGSFKKLALGAGVVAAGVSVAAIKMATDFQSASTRLVTGAGESSKNIDGVRKSLLGLAGPLGETATSLATALYPIESAGYHAADATKILTDAVEGARADGAQVGTVADALTSALNAYGLGATSAKGVTNEFVRAVSDGKTTMEQLAGSIGTVVPEAAALHVPLAQVLGAMTTMTSQGTNAAKAATSIRFALASISDPTQKATSALKAIGLTSASLGDTITKHGLVAGFQQLEDAVGKQFPAGSHEYLAAMSNIVGGTRGLQSVLELTGTHIQQFNADTKNIAAGLTAGGSAVEGWSTYTKTFQYSLDSLRAAVASLMIEFGEKLLPTVTAFTNWLASTAVPAVEEFGHVLGQIASALHPIAPELKLATEAALGLYAAIKLMQAGAAIFGTLESGFTTLRLRAMYAADGVRNLGSTVKAVAAGEQAVSWGAFAGGVAAIGVAAYAAGRGLSSLIEKNNSFAHVMDNSTNIEQSFAAALDASNGALSDSVKQTVAVQLQNDGLAAKAAKAGISLAELTAGVTGNNAAMQQLVQTWKASGDPSGDTLVATGLIAAQYRNAASNAKDLATVTKSTGAAQSTAAGAATRQATAQQQASTAEKAAAAQAKLLDTALQNLAQTQLAEGQSQDAFREGILSLTKTLHTNHDQLGLNTQAGLANRDALLQMLGQAVSLAQAQKANGAHTDDWTAALQRNVEQIKATATAAGLSKGAVAALIRQEGLTPKDIRSKFDLNTGAVLHQLDQIITKMHTIGEGVNASINVTTTHISKNGTGTTGTVHGDALIAGQSGSGDGIGGWFSAASRWASQVAAAVSAAVRPATTNLDKLSAYYAKTYGSAVNRQHTSDVDDKMLARITHQQDQIVAHAHDVYNAAAKAYSDYENHLEATSNGARTKAQRAQLASLEAAKEAAERNLQSVESAAEKAIDKAKSVASAAGAAAKAATQAAAQAAQALISQVQSQVDTMVQNIQAFQSTLASGISQGSDIATMWNSIVSAQQTAADNLASAQQAFTDAQAAVGDGTDATADQIQALADAQAALTAAQQAANAANSNVSAGGLQSVVDQTLSSVQGFAADLKSLAAEGASQDLLSQIAGMGPTSGDQLAKALLAGGKSAIGQLSSTLGQISKIADSTSQALSKDYYGTGVKAMERYIKGLMAKYPELRKALAPVEKELEKVFGAADGASGGGKGKSKQDPTGSDPKKKPPTKDDYEAEWKKAEERAKRLEVQLKTQSDKHEALLSRQEQKMQTFIDTLVSHSRLSHADALDLERDVSMLGKDIADAQLVASRQGAKSGKK